jgi:lysozyme family protein
LATLNESSRVLNALAFETLSLITMFHSRVHASDGNAIGPIDMKKFATAVNHGEADSSEWLKRQLHHKGE